MMAWTLFGFDIDLYTIALPIAKAIGGAIGGFFLKRCWRIIVEHKKCVIKDCPNFGTSITRGLCNKCHKKAKQRVDAGQTTWQELSDAGLCESTTKDPFDAAFDQMKKGDF